MANKCTFVDRKMGRESPGGKFLSPARNSMILLLLLPHAVVVLVLILTAALNRSIGPTFPMLDLRILDASVNSILSAYSLTCSAIVEVSQHLSK